MSTDSPKPTQEFTQEYFDALQAKLDRDIRENPASVDPNIIILTKQHARLHQTLNAQAKAYTNLVEMHIRREEIAILEKLEFAETIKAYQLRLMEGKKLKNRKERLQEIEKTYEKKRQEAQTCTQNLKNVVGSLSDIRAGMQAFVGEQIGFPESLRALSRSLNGTEDTPPSSTPSSSSPSIPQPRGPLPAMLLAVQDHRLERKEVEILNLKMRLAQYQRTGGPKEVSTTAENGEKSEISVNTGSGSVYTNLTNEELNEHVVRCYSALACYQKANSGLIDQLVLVEKTAYMDRMKAADKIQELQYDVLKAKKLHGQNKLMHEVKMEFVETMKGIEEKIEKSREDVRFLRDGLEQLCLETFGETKRVVDDVDWISTRNMNEAYKHKPEPTETDAHLAEKKKELARLKEELKALETAYEATLAPTNHVASKLIKHLIEELDVMGDVLESHIVHSLEVRERCTEALQDGIRMREEFVEKMRCITTQLMDARLMNEGQLAATIQVYREHEAEINRLKEETESFTKKEKELHSESVLGFQTMKDRHYEIEDQWKAEKKKLKKRLIGIDELETDSEKGEDDDYEEEDEEKKDEEKMNKDILEMKEKIAKYEKEWRELEKSVDPSVGKLNRQLTHLFGEQQASYAVLVERYISGEDLANEERRKAAETIRALKLHLLEGKKGKEKTKKVHEVEAEYKERMEYVQEKNLDVKKVVEEMKTELENLSMETFGERLEEETKQKLWETSKLPSFVSSTGMCTQSLAARLFHKLSFSAGVVETAFEKLLTQTRINIQHEYKAIEQKTKSADTWNDLHKQIMKSKTLEESQSFVKGITVIVDDEDEQQNIKDLNAFFTAMQNTKSRMSYYYNDALKEADEIGIDFSLGKKTGEEVEDNGEGTSPKTAAETVRDNNRRTRDSYIGGNFPATPEEFQQWQQKMMLINQNIKEKEKQLLEMKRRWEIEENVQKARYQQEVDQLLKEMDEAKGDREKEKEMEKKMAAWFKNKEELRKTLPLSTQAAIEASDAALVVSTNAPGPSPAPPSPPSPVPKFTTDEMRAFFTNQVLEKTKNDPEKAKELEQRVSETVYETFEMCKKFAETGKLDLTRKDQKIESLEARISDLEAKLEEKHQEYLKKDRQLSNLETGYLRRGLGISRHQLRNGRSEGGGAKEEKKAGPNSVNQYK